MPSPCASLAFRSNVPAEFSTSGDRLAKPPLPAVPGASEGARNTDSRSVTERTLFKGGSLGGLGKPFSQLIGQLNDRLPIVQPTLCLDSQPKCLRVSQFAVVDTSDIKPGAHEILARLDACMEGFYDAKAAIEMPR